MLSIYFFFFFSIFYSSLQFYLSIKHTRCSIDDDLAWELFLLCKQHSLLLATMVANEFSFKAKFFFMAIIVRRCKSFISVDRWRNRGVACKRASAHRSIIVQVRFISNGTIPGRYDCSHLRIIAVIIIITSLAILLIYTAR